MGILTNFIIMTVVDNLNFSYFLRLTWKFLGLESECGDSVCWSNNKIIDFLAALCCCGNLKKKGENEHITRLYLANRLWSSGFVKTYCLSFCYSGNAKKENVN